MKCGFTLIELLAVIVILAIIAVISTPIVLNIIKNSKISASVRSAENYIDAVENAIAKENMSNSSFNPSNCRIGKENGQSIINCDGTILNIEINGSIPERGTLSFTMGKIDKITNLKLDNYYVNKANGGLISTKDIVSICKLKNGEARSIGSKYECEVKKNTWYSFYVLSNNDDGTYNLIMDHNINSDGTPTEAIAIEKNGNNKYNIISWINQEDYITAGGKDLSNEFDCNRNGEAGGICAQNEYGPLTIISFLNFATSGWDNVPNINKKYTDEGGRYGTITFTGKARLPYNSELSMNPLSEFLYANLISETLYSYWSASSAGDTAGAYYLFCNGDVESQIVYDAVLGLGSVDIRGSFGNGVRPVITLDL